MPGYLEDLTVRLAHGTQEWDSAFRDRHAAYVLASQRNDGGFAGREGDSDLYYTSFALRCLALTGQLYGDVADQAAGFLRQRLTGEAPIVDFLSLMYGAALLDLSAGVDVFAGAQSNWRSAVAAALESFRREDGGYAKGPEGKASSTYHSFLVLLCYQLIERESPDADRLVEFLYAQQRDDGGFVEIRIMKRSGTNPTAAAVGALQILGALEKPTREDCIEFLAEMQTDEGGLRANTRIPIADLLSSFTGAWTLHQLDGLDAIDRQAVARYARSLEQPDGGFHGAAWDQASDVEYSFYGLATLALLAEQSE